MKIINIFIPIVKIWLNMGKVYVKHPIVAYIISLMLVTIAGFMKILEVESADLLLNVTFSISILSLIYVLIRLKRTRKKYTDLAN
ncbi:hypothetical protein [Empedobacter brevis]|uniref:hypothetical protein n=1 Tax=Empedobacter brevis TaxID=247 RepID=UPI002896CC66|nr:hypothetical protein [Empedobacter brevis]